MQKVIIKNKGEYSLNMANDLIKSLAAGGFSVDANLAGKAWIIVATKCTGHSLGMLEEYEEAEEWRDRSIRACVAVHEMQFEERR